MKKIGHDKIMIAVGLILLAIATWFASRTPTAPALPTGVTAVPSSTTEQTTTAPANATTTTVTPITEPVPQKIHYTTITIINPTSSARWVIGQQNTITWNKAANATGQMYLVNVTTGAIAGWIQQNIAPGQTYFPWNTEKIFLGKTSPAGKNVLPGEYIIKMSFSSPDVLPAASAPFFITTAPTSG